MINANLEQFLDTGWFSEATLYLNGYTYWCEGCWNEEREKPMHFFVYKYESVVVDKIYTKPKNSNYQTVFDIYGNGEEEVKEEEPQEDIEYDLVEPWYCQAKPFIKKKKRYNNY